MNKFKYFFKGLSSFENDFDPKDLHKVYTTLLLIKTTKYLNEPNKVTLFDLTSFLYGTNARKIIKTEIYEQFRCCILKLVSLLLNMVNVLNKVNGLTIYLSPIF